jgi:hypothetical protein
MTEKYTSLRSTTMLTKQNWSEAVRILKDAMAKRIKTANRLHMDPVAACSDLMKLSSRYIAGERTLDLYTTMMKSK